jgi:GxxExxY protein
MAMDVHRHLGPGLLESAYEECLCQELEQGGVGFTRQAPVVVVYKGLRLDCAYRIDLLIENELVVEIKAVDKLAPIHEAQLLTYLRLSGLRVGLLMNFNTTRLKDGLRRMVND